MTPGFARAALALDLLAVDPGLSGLHLRGPAGPARDALLARLDPALPPLRRLAPTAPEDALTGGLDAAATLRSGRMVWTQGALGAPATLLLPMAERTPPARAARLAGRGRTVIAGDEGTEEEALPPGLAARLALFADISGAARGDLSAEGPDRAAIAAGRALLRSVTVPDKALAELAELAATLGIDDLRRLGHAHRAARAHAALRARGEVGAPDLEVAAALVLGPRARRLPPSEEEEQAERAPPPEAPSEGGPMPDTVLDAARAVLPPGLLAGLALRGAARGEGRGARRKGGARGRPLPARPGRIAPGERLDLVATLRAAAPLQRLRGGPPGQVRILPEDVRLRRHESRSDRLLIFAVDASGSAAAARLAEAKGAVELILAESYAARDHVALVAFRGEGGETVLPPTRSLVRARRTLAGLPGGGGTPLAAGLAEALALARAARGRGMTPVIALLTDGRANVPLEGPPDRVRAAEDAARLARLIAGDRIAALVCDSGLRPSTQLRALAAAMGARYLPLPRAEPGALPAAAKTL
ncbi:protoporphyrin IX magnesium-chelatase [Hasllibacter halocynthiae]|uniref:Protoporphyrin IX magnesium-chelatase n=1 Tax=Hasllibacter halocynthiae TaxID=595589 RepID=A0A2T0X2S3_9RHOB|nr:VWA domain-containing protein [Hasllibacter halocynthiae]PRY93253.1 protoporphyrin IX magnesium-chelatase [Hasllibacter halocynthiae]